MTVGVIYDLPGATLDQYDQMISRMGYEHGGESAPGSLFHWVAATDDGIRAVDVWESRDDFDRFVQEWIVPVAQEVGLQPPQMSYYEIHCTLSPAASSG